MAHINSSNRRASLLLLAILVASLALRLGAFFVIQSVDTSRIVATDSKDYDNTARALLRAGRFAVSPETPDLPQTIRTPGYPGFIAGIYLIFGEEHSPVIVTQILISVGTLVLTYAIARRFWNPAAALISTLVLALDFASFTYSQMLLTETLFTFFLMGAVAAGVYLVLDGGGKRKRSLLLGTSLALATLVRPISHYLIYPIFVGLLVYGKIVDWKWKDILIVLLLLSLPWIALVGGWQVRNFLVTGSSELSHIRGINLLYYRGADIIAQRDGISFEEARRQIEASLPDTEGWTTAELGGFYAQEGLSLIKRYPLLFIKGQMRGAAKMMLVPGETGFLEYLGVPTEETGGMGDLFRLSMDDYIHKWLVRNPFQFSVLICAMVYLLVLYSGAIYALWQIIRGERVSVVAHVFIWGGILYFLVMSAGPEAYARFRVPIMPLLALYAGKGVSSFLARLGLFRKGDSLKSRSVTRPSDPHR